ncbi:unnamed protein product, partial [Mesorhabditis belari]|uniref:Uncharacterized protein n=1 Tax=Mesorhabditis belari TaxID=2138241 RepID=A0AAF3J8Y2_9BILA
MIQHFVVRLQSRCLSRSSGLWDRFSRETLRQRLQKVTETQRTNRADVYYSDAISLRPPRDLWKAGAFTAGVCV